MALIDSGLGSPFHSATASSALVTGTAVFTATNGGPYQGINFNFLASYGLGGTAGTATIVYQPKLQHSVNGTANWVDAVLGKELTAATTTSFTTVSTDLSIRPFKSHPYVRVAVGVTNDGTAGSPACRFRFDVTNGPRNMVSS